MVVREKFRAVLNEIKGVGNRLKKPQKNLKIVRCSINSAILNTSKILSMNKTVPIVIIDDDHDDIGLYYSMLKNLKPLMK